MIRSIGIALALLGGSVPAAAEPREPLVITRLPDPEPDFASPSRERGGRDEETVKLDEAMQNFSLAIGQATRLEQQAVAQRCRSGVPGQTKASDRFAWEARCRYQRR